MQPSSKRRNRGEAVRKPEPDEAPAVCRAGEFQFSPGHFHCNHCVQSRGLFWCKSGHGTFTVNGKEYSLEPHDLYVLPWNRCIAYRASMREPMSTAHVHVVPWLRPGSKWEANVPHERNEPLYNSPDRADLSWPGFDGVVRLHLEIDSKLGRLIHYTTSWFRESHRDEQEGRALGLLIVRELQRLRQPSAQNETRRPAELNRMLVYLDRCFASSPTVEQIGATFGRSRSHVLRLFLTHMGVSAKTYIMQRQLREARELLISTSLPVSEVGRRSGFPDPYHFSKLFRRMVGMPPSSFRSHGGVFPSPGALTTHRRTPPPAC